MKIALCQLNPIIGDLKGNSLKIIQALEKGRQQKVDLLLFSELVLTGYPPEDFLLHPHFIHETEKALKELLQHTKGVAAFIGTVRFEGGKLYNSAALLSDGECLGYQDKTLLPTYDVFDEERYFSPAEEIRLFQIAGQKVGVTLCEDIWHHAGKVPHSRYSKDPVHELSLLKPDLVVNLSASPYHFHKFKERLQVASKAAKTLRCPLILSNQVGGNDSLIFDGASFALNARGEVCEKLAGFQEDFKIFQSESLTPQTFQEPDPIEELYRALLLGLKDYFAKSGFTQACLGLSGGIDSAVVACLGAEALGRENLLAVAMPSRYSSESSFNDARGLAHNLGVTLLEIPIEEPFKAYLDLLTPYFEGKSPDTTEENLQARIRGMILMALSNKHHRVVLSTGNKSEMAMGYSTLYGDLTGGLAILADVSKERVYQLARYINRAREIIPLSTLEKEPSAELRPGQKDSDTLPPYAIIDKVLEGYVERQKSPEQISQEYQIPLKLVQELIRKIHLSEYKRRQAPPGLRITEKAFSVGRHYPIVQRFVN